MKTQKVTKQSFVDIQSSGRGVPHSQNYLTEITGAPGKLIRISCDGEFIIGKVTQTCPVHIIVEAPV